jgi:hypothetical protein
LSLLAPSRHRSSRCHRRPARVAVRATVHNFCAADTIVAGIAEHAIVARQGVDRVVAAATMDNVVPGSSPDVVVVVVTVDYCHCSYLVSSKSNSETARRCTHVICAAVDLINLAHRR